MLCHQVYKQLSSQCGALLTAVPFGVVGVRWFTQLALLLWTLSVLPSISPAVLPLLLQVVLRPMLLAEVSLRIEDPKGLL